MSFLDSIQSIDKGQVPKCDFHIHTDWTDGKDSITDNYNKAIEEGLISILFSEHARKTSADWFVNFAKEVRSLPVSSCQPLVGVEVKVLNYNGEIDSVDEILEICDLVMGVVHRFPGEEQVQKGISIVNKEDAIKVETELSLALMEVGNIDILGHPLGMSINRFGLKPSEDDFIKVIKKASECNVAIEINSHYHSDLWGLIELCKAENATISLGSNAHSANKVGHINRILRGEEAL